MKLTNSGPSCSVSSMHRLPLHGAATAFPMSPSQVPFLQGLHFPFAQPPPSGLSRGSQSVLTFQDKEILHRTSKSRLSRTGTAKPRPPSLTLPMYHSVLRSYWPPRRKERCPAEPRRLSGMQKSSSLMIGFVSRSRARIGRFRGFATCPLGGSLSVEWEGVLRRAFHRVSRRKEAREVKSRGSS